jgi:DNA-directed RNA polymerase specialized sigma24 family protein
MGDRSTPDPEELLRQARTGSAEALGQLLELYRNYPDLLARVQIGRRLQQKVDASDLVQETFLKAHRDFAKFRGQSEAEWVGWLRQILALNLAHLVRRYCGTRRRDVRLELAWAMQQELAERQKLVADFPQFARYHFHLAMSQYNRGTRLYVARRFREAEGSHRQTLELFKELTSRFPDVPDYQCLYGRSSLDLIDAPARVAGDKTLVLTVHEQVQDFEDDSADQGTVALRFHKRIEEIVPAQKLDINPFGLAAPGTAPIGVTDIDRIPQVQTQLVGHPLGKHERGCTRVYPAGYGLSPDLLAGQQTAPSQLNITEIGNFKIDRKTSHAVGSFRCHAGSAFAGRSLIRSADWMIGSRVHRINPAERFTARGTKDTKGPMPILGVFRVLFLPLVSCHRGTGIRNQLLKG